VVTAYAFPANQQTARGASSVSFNGNVVVPDWRRPQLASYNPTSSGVAVSDLAEVPISGSVNAAAQLSGFLSYVDTVQKSNSSIPYLLWLQNLGYYHDIALDNSESTEYGQFVLPDSDIISVDYPYEYPYFGFSASLALPATLPATMSTTAPLPMSMWGYSAMSLLPSVSGYTTAVLSSGVITGYSVAGLAETFTFASGYAGVGLGACAYFEDTMDFYVANTGADSVSIEPTMQGWLSTSAYQETGYVAAANDSSYMWAVGYGEGMLQYGVDGPVAQWSLPFGKTFCGVVLESSLPYILTTDGMVYTVNDNILTQLSGAVTGSTCSSLQSQGGIMYALVPVEAVVMPYVLNTAVSGSPQQSIPVPMDTPYTLSTGASGSSGLLGVTGTDNYALGIPASDMAYLSLLDQVFVAQQSANEIQVLQKNADDLWTVAQTVSGVGGPTYVAALTTAEQILVSNTNANTLQIIPETDGVWGSGTAQSISITAPGQIALSTNNAIAFVCQTGSNEVALFQNTLSVWSASGSLSIPSPNRVLVTGANTAYCASSSGIVNLIQLNGSWQVSGSIVTPLPVNDVAVDTLGGMYAVSTNGVSSQLDFTGTESFVWDSETLTGDYFSLTNNGTDSVSAAFNTSTATLGSLDVYFAGVLVGGASWNGSADRVLWYEGQILVLDKINNAMRVFGLVGGQYVQQNYIPTVPSADAIVNTTDTWLFGGTAIWQYEWAQPYTLSRSQSAIVAVYNIVSATWGTFTIGRKQRALSATFDATGNLWVATDANQLYALNSAGGLISSNQIPVYSKQLQTTPLGISSLTWMDGTLYGSSCLNDAIAVGL
jgi:hypothetical protein